MDAVDAELLRELEKDEQLDGSAADELGLALDLLEKLQQVGCQPSAADRKALLAAAHALGVPELAARTLRAVASGMRGPEQQAPQLGIAGKSLAGVMEAGGWERSSAEDFLAGLRALPKRDATSKLGELSTRYLDPLLGVGGDD